MQAVSSSPIDELNRRGYWINIFQQPPYWHVTAYSSSKKLNRQLPFVQGKGLSIHAAAQTALEESRRPREEYGLKVHEALRRQAVERDRFRTDSDDLF